jgi:hypothetical protein
MTKSIAVCAVLYFAATQAAGQLVVTPLDPQRTHGSISDPVLMAAADGRILMRLRGLTEDDPPRFWSSVYVLDPVGKILQRIDFPDTESTVVVPYRNGFVARHYFESQQCNPPCGRYIPGRSELVYYDLSREKIEPVVVDRREGHVDVVGGPDRSDLYLIDVGSEEPQVPRITRLDDEFKPIWSRSFVLLDSGSVTAIDDGVVLEQQYYVGAPKFVLRAIGRDGVERWNTVIPERVIDGIKFVPTGFLVVPASSRLSPYRVDAKTGRMLPDVDLPPANFTAATEDGLLLVGPMLGQSYAAMLKADGTFAWMRRFNQDSDLRTFKDGIMTSDGRLLLVAAGDFSSKFTFLSVDRSGKALEMERSACLTVASPEALALNGRLQGQAVYVGPPNSPNPDPELDPPTPRRDGCPVVTEPQYMAFMGALLSGLPPAASQRRQFPQVSIRLTESGEPTRMHSYGLGGGGWTPWGVYSEFWVPHDRGAEFAQFFSSIFQAHVRRMLALESEFERMTRISYGASIGKTANVQQALADLEAAAFTLNERIKAMPPDKIAYVLATRHTDCVGATLTPDGFGTGYDNDPFGNRPLSDAVETLLHIAELRRKSVAQGDICTIG